MVSRKAMALTALIFLAFPIWAYGQEATLSGIVTDGTARYRVPARVGTYRLSTELFLLGGRRSIDSIFELFNLFNRELRFVRDR